VPLLLAVELVSGTVRMALALWHSHLTSVGVVEIGSHDDVSQSEPIQEDGHVDQGGGGSDNNRVGCDRCQTAR
jgi:hypothetical protein